MIYGNNMINKSKNKIKVIKIKSMTAFTIYVRENVLRFCLQISLLILNKFKRTRKLSDEFRGKTS